jgi:hypothetical protein
MEFEKRSWQRPDGTWVELAMPVEAWERWDRGEPVAEYSPQEVLLPDEDGSLTLRRLMGG